MIRAFSTHRTQAANFDWCWQVTIVALAGRWKSCGSM
jgi:hypothetical protein